MRRTNLEILSSFDLIITTSIMQSGSGSGSGSVSVSVNKNGQGAVFDIPLIGDYIIPDGNTMVERESENEHENRSWS